MSKSKTIFCASGATTAPLPPSNEVIRWINIPLENVLKVTLFRITAVVPILPVVTHVNVPPIGPVSIVKNL